MNISRRANFNFSNEDCFVEYMIKEINKKLEEDSKKIYFRIHASGDFYDKDYIKKWDLISSEFKNSDKVKFVAYTKSIILFNEYLNIENKKLEDINIKFLYSIMPDTEEKYKDIAKSMEMATYEVMKCKDEVKILLEKDSEVYFCEMDCSQKCGLKCYNDDIERKKKVTIMK